MIRDLRALTWHEMVWAFAVGCIAALAMKAVSCPVDYIEADDGAKIVTVGKKQWFFPPDGSQAFPVPDGVTVDGISAR